MYLIDSHCHLDFPCFDNDRDVILERCQQQGIKQIIVPGVSRQSWEKLLNLCQHTAMLHPALGLHPVFLSAHQTDVDIAALETAIQQHSPIAVGEIGLDFFIADHDKAKQLALFSAQIELAETYQLPVILHVRKAHDEVLKVLRQHSLSGGIVHAFNGSMQQANAYMKLGFVFGIGGALTYSRAHRLHRLFSTLPLEHIVLETDAPDMPLANQQETRNTPENLPQILTTLATLRSISPSLIAQITSANCQRLFKF